MPPATPLQVILLADPGLPSRRAQAARPALEEHLNRRYDRPVRVNVVSRLLRMDQASALDHSAAAEVTGAYEEADVVLMLTEVPRFVDHHPLVAGVFPEERLAAVSLPTLGVWMGSSRVARVMYGCVLRILGDPGDPQGARESRHHPVRDLSSARWVRREDGSHALQSTSWMGAVRMVLGMVMSNEPWATAPRLGNAFAAALATGAFGIFYSSVWQMSDALSLARLLFTALVAISVMVLWLVLRNRLWDAPSEERSRELVLLYNLSTGVTLTLVVTALYAMLTVIFLVAGLIVIAPGFMSDVLGYPADFPNYLKIAWFSAALGVVAGGLGTSFDDETDLRTLTHGQRERERIARAEQADAEREAAERMAEAAEDQAAREGQVGSRQASPTTERTGA